MHYCKLSRFIFSFYIISALFPLHLLIVFYCSDKKNDGVRGRDDDDDDDDFYVTKLWEMKYKNGVYGKFCKSVITCSVCMYKCLQKRLYICKYMFKYARLN